ncbi:aspartate aminotransferase [Acuticoccus sediminis]|uniref:Aspartate aminotransferase n=1 Tax=Acuticoccus sediminis TaxID=2184697 RepID=A0A8B2NCI7_9HYPH|nr:PLP-dependent aminotransferase family protein [Acuticoccus sediminis]RAH96089.1 aspartate aminotransferase [Acuticoccus sediminis]
MRIQSPWRPRLSGDHTSPLDALVAALAQDILAGRLESGDRLPAHRDLAWRLGIAIGTVTKAYGVLERRGLVRSVKGRGTFVAAAARRSGDLIDLSRNAPPAALGERTLAKTLAAVARKADAGLFNAYPPLAGHTRFRTEVARWFRRSGMNADPARLLLTNGAQHGLAVSLATLCGPGGTVFAETQTYPGIIGLARHLGLKLVPVAMDGEGMLPCALDRALADRREDRAAVCLTPTMHNPTTGTMSMARRQEIVAVCRTHDRFIVEDDVYALYAGAARPPLAVLAPERVFYVNSLSKTLNPSLRIGGIVVPQSMVDRAEAAVHAGGLLVSTLSCAVMEQWVADGTADIIGAAIREEARRRRALCASLLGDAMRRCDHDGYHVWLPLPRKDAEHLELAARSHAIHVTPPSATRTDPEDPTSGVRLCIGAPTLEDLDGALRAIRSILDAMAAERPAHHAHLR